MPQEIISYISKNFNAVYGSPFSSSFYSEEGQSWDFTPKNQIRVSDHWNFKSRDYSDPDSVFKTHGQTNVRVENDYWTIAKKSEKGIAGVQYEVILTLPKKQIVPKIYKKGNDLLANKQPNEVLFKMERKKNISVSKKIADTRAVKMKNETLWVTFDRTYTERVSARKFNKIEEKGVLVLLTGETSDFITVKFAKGRPAFRYKKSTLSNYKELTKKPTSKK